MEIVKVKIRVGYPGEELAVREYNVPWRPGITVLDTLDYIWKKLDPSIAFRYECRSGKCGVCGVTVNGRKCLACATAVAKGQIIGPLDSFPLIRDLVVELH